MILRESKTTIVIALMVLIASSASFNAAAQQTTQAQMDAEEALKDQEKWTEDIDKKLDTTIKVLSVIKEELEAEEKKQEGIVSKTPPATTEEEQKEFVKSTASWLTRLKRMWQEARKAAAPEGEEAEVQAQIAKEEKEQAIDTKEISEKLGTAISLMAAIKEELDKEQKQQQESK